MCVGGGDKARISNLDRQLRAGTLYATVTEMPLMLWPRILKAVSEDGN